MTSSSINLKAHYTGTGGWNSWKRRSKFILCFIMPPTHYNYVRQNYINGIISHLTGDVMNILTLSAWQYEQIKTLNQIKSRLKNAGLLCYQRYFPTLCHQNASKFSLELQFFSRQVQKRYAHVLKEHNKPKKTACVVFKPRYLLAFRLFHALALLYIPWLASGYTEALIGGINSNAHGEIRR